MNKNFQIYRDSDRPQTQADHILKMPELKVFCDYKL